MHSLSCALLEAIDERLCSLISEPKKQYLDLSFDDIQTMYTRNCEVGGGGTLGSFFRVFGVTDGYLCFNKAGSVLAIETSDGYYRTFTCTSSCEDVESFLDICIDGTSEVYVSNEKVMTRKDVSISFR